MEKTQKSGVIHTLMAGLYIFLSFLSFYCACYRLPVGVKYIVSCFVTAIAALVFLIKPNFERMKFCGKLAAMYFAPFFLFWLWSLMIWTKDFQTTDYIIRGTKNIVYMLTNILYFCSAFYLFGKKSIYYTFYAMCAANFAVLIEVGVQYGFGPLFSEYATLLTSFANETGSVIRRMELHDMVFGWGPYILYFILYKDEGTPWWKNVLLLIPAFFFFTVALKRIAVLAVGIALLFGIAVKCFRTSNKCRLYFWTAVCIGALCFLYVVVVKNGEFIEYMRRLGINLMGRQRIYAYYDDFFEVSPTFLGQGIRFLYNYSETHEGIGLTHNVFLELFIELGFVMWFVWVWYDLRFRIKWMAKRYSYASAECLFVMCLYAFVTYMTDNTYFYYPINVTYRLLAMVWCYQTAVKRHMLKDFGPAF